MNCNNPNATKSKGKYVATDGTEHENKTYHSIPWIL